MFKRLIFYPILFIIMACSSGIFRHGDYHGPSKVELEKIRYDLQKLSNGTLGSDSTSLDFVQNFDNPNVIGRCNFNLKHFQKEVDILEGPWYSYTERKKISILAHEHRHCDCNFYEHIDGEFEDGCPSHYMGTHAATEACLKEHWNEYTEQFKRGCDS
jgi:hypothetical protein